MEMGEPGVAIDDGDAIGVRFDKFPQLLGVGDELVAIVERRNPLVEIDERTDVNHRVFRDRLCFRWSGHAPYPLFSKPMRMC